MSNRIEKVKDIMEVLDYCFNLFETHIFDMLEEHPKTPTHIKSLLDDLLRYVARASIKAEVIIDELNIIENKHIA